MERSQVLRFPCPKKNGETVKLIADCQDCPSSGNCDIYATMLDESRDRDRTVETDSE